jgi:hypothetical protein
MAKKKIVFAVVAVGFTALLVAAYTFKSSSTMSSMNMESGSMSVAATPAMRQSFIKLAAAHTDVCQDMGNKPAIDRYMSMLPSGSSLQGSCCSPMDMKKYVGQVTSLKQYSGIPQIPKDPYDMSVANARDMLGYYDNIQLSSAQQSVYSTAQSMTADKGWCCCQCWAWYTHGGLAKYLITHNNYTAKQVVDITNLEDCCGGAS